MPTIDVPRDQWPQFLETFSREHRAWLTTIESPLHGLAEARPLGAVTTTRHGRDVSAIEISFAGDSGADTVRVENPMSMRVHQTADGTDRALDIVDDEGLCTRIGFRVTARREMLDGMAPGEL